MSVTIFDEPASATGWHTALCSTRTACMAYAKKEDDAWSFTATIELWTSQASVARESLVHHVVTTTLVA
jgi:hypothetical protein